MNITAAAIEKNRITIVVLVIIALAGWSAFRNMPRAEDPGMLIRVAQILTFFPGAGPERVELLVTDKLEKAIQEIAELDFVYSESKNGVSIILVNIVESEKNLRPIWDNLRRKLERAQPELPDAVIGPIVNDEFGDVFGIVITLTGEDFSYRELKDRADEVRNELLYIDQVAKVEIYGDQEERTGVQGHDSQAADEMAQNLQSTPRVNQCCVS